MLDEVVHVWRKDEQVPQLPTHVAVEVQFPIPPQDVLQDATHRWLAAQPYVAPAQTAHVETQVRVEAHAKLASGHEVQFGRHASTNGQ
jgi:hypothetical protein